MEIALRLVFVVATVALAFWITGITARRLGARRRAPLPDGIVLVTGPGCRLCGPAEQAIRAAGGDPITVIDVSDRRVDDLAIRSLPLGLVVRDGEIVMRRAGKTVLQDAALLANATSAQAA